MNIEQTIEKIEDLGLIKGIAKKGYIHLNDNQWKRIKNNMRKEKELEQNIIKEHLRNKIDAALSPRSSMEDNVKVYLKLARGKLYEELELND